MANQNDCIAFVRLEELSEPGVTFLEDEVGSPWS